MFVNIDPATNASVTAADICATTFARRDAYAQELLTIAVNEGIHGFMLDWEDAEGNDVACFNALWGSVAQALKPHGVYHI